MSANYQGHRLPTMAAMVVASALGLPLRAFGETEKPSRPTWSDARIVAGREAPGFVAFTFDDGPNLSTTPSIVETLQKFHVPATFFVVGRHFTKATDDSRATTALLLKMEQRGFSIGNHTSNHQNLTRLSEKMAKRAVSENAANLAKLLGHRVSLFRPPFGATTKSVRLMLKRRGDTTVRWNIDSQDFQRTRRKGLVKRVLGDILRKGGGIVLLHDTKPWTASALPKILADLETENCRRIQSGLIPIIPVSLHYFLRNQDGTPRAIPAEVSRMTQASINRLDTLCKTQIDNPYPPD